MELESFQKLVIEYEKIKKKIVKINADLSYLIKEIEKNHKQTSEENPTKGTRNENKTESHVQEEMSENGGALEEKVDLETEESTESSEETEAQKKKKLDGEKDMAKNIKSS